VLTLSQFAGAAKELDEALIVNPHQIDAVAAALKRALEMPLDERSERDASMLARLLKNDINRWANPIVYARRRENGAQLAWSLTRLSQAINCANTTRHAEKR
jgi:trehalose-6-phosphate synthase